MIFCIQKPSDSEDFGPALADALPPSGQEARPAAYSELVDVLSRATEKLVLELIGAHSKPERRKLPFFSDLHREISSSWKQPYSSRLTNAAAADFTNLVGSVEQGYTAMPVLEDTLASHLSPSLAPSWKSRPLLPSKPCRATSALIVFPPLQLVHSPPASRMLGDTAVSLLQCMEPVPATRQPSTSLSIILNKDAEGSPSRWRVPLLPGLLDTPSQVCLPLHDTLIPLSHFLHEWERLPGVSLWVLRTIRNVTLFSLEKNPPPFRRGSPDSSKQRLQGLCSTTGTFLPPTERSNRGITAVGSRTRILQPLLPRSKEGRRLEAYSGSTAFEFFPLQREVQDADDKNHYVSGPGGRLVCHHRPEGCVFSHPGLSKTQEVPSVCLWRVLPVSTRATAYLSCTIIGRVIFL